MVQETELSRRERQVAEAYAGGLSYRQIAASLCVAPTTVRTHLSTIYRKLGVSSKLELHEALNGGLANRQQRDDAALVSELALSLEESRSRESAVGEVLRIISRSQGDVADVIAAVLEYALDLCDAEFGILFGYEPSSGFRAAYMLGIPPPFENWLARRGTFQVDGRTGLGRVECERTLVNIADVRGEALYRLGDPLRCATVDLGGARSFAAVPMLAGDRLVGAFTVYRQELRPFDGKSLELAQMFADQSVIAIENARLISQLRA